VYIGVDIVSATNTVVGGAGAARNIISGNGTGMQMRTGGQTGGEADEPEIRQLKAMMLASPAAGPPMRVSVAPLIVIPWF
jgi:hypothetical protein